MTITLDINVGLDVFQKREPHYAASARVMALVVLGAISGVFPAHALTTLYYLTRKHASRPDAEKALDEILRYFSIGNLNSAGWRRARQLGLTDFEDAVVATVAEQTGSSFIITRNVSDFEGAPVPAMTPADFLTQFAPTPQAEDGS